MLFLNALHRMGTLNELVDRNRSLCRVTIYLTGRKIKKDLLIDLVKTFVRCGLLQNLEIMSHRNLRAGSIPEIESICRGLRFTSVYVSVFGVVYLR